jgi:hypothetical protein
MSEKENDRVQPMPEQITYANLLFGGAWTGIALMIITYIVYATGILSPHVDMTLVTQNWGKGVDEYLKITNSPRGWGWLALMDKGDFLNFLGLAFIALLTIACYLSLIVAYRKRKDWIYFTICVTEVVVLSIAASGILGVGGH